MDATLWQHVRQFQWLTRLENKRNVKSILSTRWSEAFRCHREAIKSGQGDDLYCGCRLMRFLLRTCPIFRPSRLPTLPEANLYFNCFWGFVDVIVCLSCGTLISRESWIPIPGSVLYLRSHQSAQGIIIFGGYLEISMLGPGRTKNNCDSRLSQLT